MADSPSLSTLTLPPDLDADDVIGLRDQLRARFAAVVQPSGEERPPGDLARPEGVAALEALPPHLGRPWSRFDAAATHLQTFRESRASAQAEAAHAASDETEQNAANADADDRWRAFEKWNGAAAGLTDDGEKPSPAEARWLHAQLFAPPDGLRFITRRPRAQWTAMEQRMKVLEGDRAKAVVEGFGGARHMRQLAAAHARFGKAFGFTAVAPPAEGGPTDGRSQWVAAREALRVLVQKIESYADPEIEGTESLSTFLLAPYIEMVVDLEKARRARPKTPEPKPAPSNP
ncbi:MAG: hypothetical protein IT372_11610 [Polyangiaceae bacterium]|nr:hypothetical protein [Polyangiaceae bacterium]